MLKVNYTTRDIAQQSITSEINKFYQTNYPEIDRARGASVQQAGEEVADDLPAQHLPRHACDLGHAPE